MKVHRATAAVHVDADARPAAPSSKAWRLCVGYVKAQNIDTGGVGSSQQRFTDLFVRLTMLWSNEMADTTAQHYQRAPSWPQDTLMLALPNTRGGEEAEEPRIKVTLVAAAADGEELPLGRAEVALSGGQEGRVEDLPLHGGLHANALEADIRQGAPCVSFSAATPLSRFPSLAA